MRISERVDNAVRAMAVIAAGDGRAVKTESIAQQQCISVTYLHDILGELRRAGLVKAKRGPDGGYTLARPASGISLADVFRAIDGPLADVHDVSLRSLTYPEPAAALPVVWMAIRASLRRALETVSLAELISGELPAQVRALADEYRTSTEERFGH
jgi:Rrf2 family protein